LNDGAVVEEHTEFGPSSRLVYSIAPGDAFSATFDAQRISIHVPRAILRNWATTDQVSIEAHQQSEGAPSLKILIEKDFQCSNPGESQVDAFPNPNKCT
jgi:hypothetical protein